MAIKADTSMTIRMNSETKHQAQEIFSELGMDMTTAINVFLKQAVRLKGFPFDVKLPNEETLLAIQNVRNKVGLSKPFSSVDELMEDLDAED